MLLIVKESSQLDKENDNYLNKQHNKKINQIVKNEQIICKNIDRKPSILSKFLKKDKFTEQIKKINSQYIIQNYFTQILEKYINRISDNKEFLKNHSITSRMRAKLIEWMIQVFESFKMSYGVLFKAVWILDTYLKRSIKKQTIESLHLLGIACMFIVCKYEQVEPISLNTFCKKISHQKFVSKQVLNKESQILKCLGFSLQHTTLNQLLSFIQSLSLLQLVIVFKKIQPQCIQFFKGSIRYLQTIILFDYDLIQQNISILSAAIVYISLKAIEQRQSQINAQDQIQLICILMNLSLDQAKQTSKNILDLSKNFKFFYPQLKKLHKICNFIDSLQNQ